MRDLHGQQSFVLAEELPGSPGFFDRAQVEQALINLLKNAHESGSAPGTVELAVIHVERSQRIEVRDAGRQFSLPESPTDRPPLPAARRWA